MSAELIARLEAAEAGSSHLDGEIRWMLDGTDYGPKSYTTSFDAALALGERVLPGWVYQVDVQSDLSWARVAPDWWAPAFGQGPEARGGQSSAAKTPALAVCAAILKAKNNEVLS